MSYEQVCVTDELSRSVQHSVGVPIRRHETLGELVRTVAAGRGICRPEDLISEEPTRQEVGVGGQILHTHCFVDALMLPFVLRVSMEEEFDLARDWISRPTRGQKGTTCCCLSSRHTSTGRNYRAG